MQNTAAPNTTNGAAKAAAGSATAGSEATLGAIRTLRLLLIGAVVAPLLLGAIGAYVSYRASYRSAATELGEAAAVAEENTTKILDTHMLVAARIGDLLSGLSDAEIHAQEQPLHEHIARQIADLPQVAAAWVIDANGHEMVSARVYPVNQQLDHADRDDFRALRDGRGRTYIAAVRARSLDRGDYQAYFTVSRRRETADGRFDGIIVVAVSGNYFASFYNSLLGGSAQYTASVLRDDGTSLARYPETAAPPASRQDNDPLAKAIADKSTAGIAASGSPFGIEGSVAAYRRLSNYPVYVAIARTRTSIVHEWLELIVGYAAFGVPAAIGFILLSLVALRRTRREQAALAAARDAIAQRAAVEAQLHQAQKMEAVGLLTAGIAHDFNNLLTVVSGNIALLKSAGDAADPRRQKFIAAAIAACDRASALTKRLLSFARREPVDPRAVDVNEVMTGVSDLVLRSLGAQIAVELRLSSGLWPVFVDPNQLENAVLNLAVNARDAIAGQGGLTIEAFNCGHADAALHPAVAGGDYVAIVVSDTGCGMPPAIRDKAFDPFFTTKEAGKGTGLGLSQVYGFVTRFGGHCTIDSEPGRGTTVKLYLPRYRGAPNGAGAGKAALEGANP